MTFITIKDRPCGWGKTTDMLATLKTDEKYLVVVPFLSETERVACGARKHGLSFRRPGFDEQNNRVQRTKGEHAEKLITDGRNVVCTHELFYRLGALSTLRVSRGLKQVSPLEEYNLIIDEVLNPFAVEERLNRQDFEQVYLKLGLAEVNDRGLVLPTRTWEESIEAGGKTLNPALYCKAKSGALYYNQGQPLIATIPLGLFQNCKSVTVLTFMSEGSYLEHYIRKLQSDGYDFSLETDRLSTVDLDIWRSDVRSSLNICSIKGLESLPLSYRKQMSGTKAERKCAGKKVGHALMNLKSRAPEFKGVDANQILITCARDNWYSTKPDVRPRSSYWSATSRLFGHPSGSEAGEWKTTGANWVSNTTRGTNEFSNCSHAIYLYDQYPNPAIINFLSISGKEKNFQDAYALTEIVQWLFRCQIRKGGYGLDKDGQLKFRGKRQPTTLFVPSRRMKNLLTNWLAYGVVNADTI